MRAHRVTIRFTPWVFALALLLKAAVPLLAAQAAQWQGKALAEVCTVYGVAMVPVDLSDSKSGQHGGAAHAGEHCALSGWVAMSSPQTPAAVPRLAHASAPPRPEAAPVQRRDSCAAWAARLQHGPPTSA